MMPGPKAALAGWRKWAYPLFAGSRRHCRDDPDRKPEALLALDQSPYGLRALILFDGEKEGAPVAVNMPLPW